MTDAVLETALAPYPRERHRDLTRLWFRRGLDRLRPSEAVRELDRLQSNEENLHG